MADEKKVIEIDINVDAAIKDASALKQNIDKIILMLTSEDSD